MTALYISEFEHGVSAIGTEAAQMLPQPAIVDQYITLGGASVQSAAFNAKTRAVLLSSSAACHLAFGANPVAVGGVSFRLPVDTPIVFAVIPGQKVAAIT